MIQKVSKSLCTLLSRSSKASLTTFGFSALKVKTGSTRSISSHFEQPSTHELFNYTSGRFLYNEQLRLSERKLSFNFKALCDIVSKTLEQNADQITSVRKIGEGGSFRVFDFRFRDGTSAIARLPYSSLQPLERGIASEAATIEFLRLHGLPTPEVFSWSASSNNEVGSAYMILERAVGAELSKSWITIEMKQRAKTILSIVEFEKKLFDIALPAYGGIYFKGDPSIANETIVELGAGVGSDQFVIGPSAEHLWYYAGRDQLGVSSGPWPTVEDLINAVVDREMAWMEQYATARQPRDSFFYQSPDMEPAEPLVHIEALEKFRKMSLALVPDEHFLTRPLLRHPDLSPSNIFVTDTEVTSVIDWQHATSLPLYVQALIPAHFQFYGDPTVTMVAKPTLPPDFESLTPAQQQVALETYRRRQCHVFYSASMGSRNIDFFYAMNDPMVVLRGKLFDHGRSPWEGNNATLREDLLTCIDHWEDFNKPQSDTKEETSKTCIDRSETNSSAKDGTSDAGETSLRAPPCPIRFTDQEKTEIEALAKQATAAEEDAELAMEGIGISSDGWVAHENYDKAKAQEADLKRFMLERADDEAKRRYIIENWPYLDHEEIP